MKRQRSQEIRRQLMVTVLTAIMVSLPRAKAQEVCDLTVPGVPNPSRVGVFMSGFWNSAQTFIQSSVSHLNYHEMTNNDFPGVLAAFRLADGRVARAGETERTVRVQFVSGPYFDVLWVRAQVGRMFNVDDDRPEDSLAVAVISDRLWSSMFYHDPGVVGQTVNVNGRSVTIVGIAPPGFRGVLQSSDETLWLPGASVPGANDRGTAEGYSHFIMRLGDEITWHRARRHFETLPAALVKAFPDVNQKFKTVSFYDLGLLSCGPR